MTDTEMIVNRVMEAKAYSDAKTILLNAMSRMERDFNFYDDISWHEKVTAMQMMDDALDYLASNTVTQREIEQYHLDILRGK